MEAKDAIRSAKTYVAEMFAADGAADVALEEIEYDDARRVWNITIGFIRPVDNPVTPATALIQQSLGLTEIPPGKRTYRVVQIRDDDQKILAVKIRELLQ